MSYRTVLREIHTLKQDQGGREHATLTKLQQKLGTMNAFVRESLLFLRAFGHLMSPLFCMLSVVVLC